MASGEQQPLPIDTSLLGGLDPAMSKEEQKQITSLMTSGDPEKLAQAATILSGMAELCKKGVTPSRRSEEQSKEVKALNETPYTNQVAVRKAMLEGRNSLVKQIRLQEAEVKEKKRLHPLPSRMPRYAWIEPFDPAGHGKDGLMRLVGVPTIGKTPIGKGPLGRRVQPSLTFADDTWDGSLSDAFSKITVDSRGTVKKQRVENRGVGHILDAAGGSGTVLVEKPQPRVVIHEAANDAARKGLHCGDVVTHVNGEAFHGTSADLLKLLEKIKEEGKQKLNIVVNAELCVAEALHVRAMC